MSEFVYQMRWYLPIWLIGLLTNWWPDNRISLKIRGFIARPFIGSCGSRLQLGRNVTLLNTHKMNIGADVYLAQGCWLNGLGGLTIEDEVILSPYVVISTLQHQFKNGSVRFGGSTSAPVRIGQGSWLASHVSVKCGVFIGRGSLIAANSMVATSTGNHEILSGVPAQFVNENYGKTGTFIKRTDQ